MTVSFLFQKRANQILSVLLPCVLAATHLNCGKSDPNDSIEGAPDSTANQNPNESQNLEYIPVEGGISFRSQCPYGTLSRSYPAKVGLWQCPTQLSQVQLTSAPPELLLPADCQKKIITIRTADRKLDLTWETLPDGSFSLEAPPLPAAFAEDGSGGGACFQWITASLWGKLTCQDRERATLKFESVWWLKGSGQSESLLRSCGFAPDCYLHAPMAIEQC